MAATPSIPAADLDVKHSRAAFDPIPAEPGTGVYGATPFRAEQAGHADITWPQPTTESARPAVNPMATSLLGRRVSEYLALARADVQRRVAMESRDRAESRTASLPAPTAPPQRRLAWPEHLPESALDTLQKFQAAHARMPVPIDRSRTLSPHADTPHAPRPWRPDGDEVPGHDSTRDLSVQMAEVLRTQAIRHGIDLT